MTARRLRNIIVMEGLSVTLVAVYAGRAGSIEERDWGWLL